MNIVFLNSFDRANEEDRIVTTTIHRRGAWRLAVGVWYDGTSWEELLTTFRHGVAVKLGEGYKPMIIIDVG